MTGAVQAAVGAIAAGNMLRSQVTTGTGGANTFGYVLSTYGAMAPSVIKAATVSQLGTSLAIGGFVLTLSGTLTQGFISGLLIEQDVANSYTWFGAQSATFSVLGGPTSRWVWSGAPWNSAGITRRVLVYY